MIDAAVAAIRAGEAVVLPTDTVYGLCVMPFEQEPARLLYGLKAVRWTSRPQCCSQTSPSFSNAFPSFADAPPGSPACSFPGRIR